MTKSLVAVIDIGKTNKKVALIDDQLRQVAFRQAAFTAQPGADDGVLHEPVEAMWSWFRRSLADLWREQPFHAIAISTHGATLAVLDADGELALPVVAYDHALPEAEQARLDAAFARLCGPLDRLQEETGTCDLPLLINPAKALLWYKQAYPAGMSRAVRVLNYPQYWGHLLTGVAASEPTYTYNHSFLHGIHTRAPSSAARALGVDGLLDRRCSQPWDQLGLLRPRLQAELGLPPLPVAVGIHDSNAALLPYLVTHPDRDFCLLSTGTWCVAMHRVPEARYEAGELGRKIIFNVDALGGLQKVAFLMGGQEYGCYHELIGGEHVSELRPERLAAALERLGDGILPGAFPSQFPACHGGAVANGSVIDLPALRGGRRPDWFTDTEQAHLLLNVSLALQTAVAIERTGVSPETAVFIEGGFRQNPTFRAVLAAARPRGAVACTSLEQATAVGTAMLGHALLRGGSPADLADRVNITASAVHAPELPGFQGYRDWWHGVAGA